MSFSSFSFHFFEASDYIIEKDGKTDIVLIRLSFSAITELEISI